MELKQKQSLETVSLSLSDHLLIAFLTVIILKVLNQS